MNDDPAFTAKVEQIVKNYLQVSAFSDKKVTDTPTDALGVVNRRYVTLHGTSANRPTASVLGQSYFDTTLGKPVWWDGTRFVDATGSLA